MVVRRKAKTTSGKKSSVSEEKGKSKYVLKRGKDRDVLYPEYAVKICTDLGIDEAKKLLGWEEEGSQKFGRDYLLKDYNGVKIRCNHDLRNRPLLMGHVAFLKQEILRNRWKMNFDGPIIIGKTGLVLNGQHTLVAEVLATQEWEDNEDLQAIHKNPPVIQKLMCFGCDEDDATVNTMDTCKPRSLADVIYRSGYFAADLPHVRNTVSHMLEHAVRILWDRTGASTDCYATYRTHAESLEFIRHHGRLMDCVKTIYGFRKEKTLSNLIPLGKLSGLFYLMATSKSNSNAYYADDPPSEGSLDWSQWETALSFVQELAKKDSPLAKTVSKSIAGYMADGRLTTSVRHAVWIKSWNLYCQKGAKITESDLALQFIVNEDGAEVLAECPITGGIDICSTKKLPEADEELIVANDPLPNVIEKRAKEERKQAIAKESTVEKIRDHIRKKPPKRKRAPWREGDLAWIQRENEDPFRIKIIDLNDKTCKGKIYQGFQGAGNVIAAYVSELLRHQPKHQKAV